MSRLALSVVGVAFLLRLAHVLTIRDYPLFDVLPLDSESYDRWARDIVSGDLARGRPFYQAPLYAYFLAALHSFSGGDLLLPRLANAVLGTINVALVMRLGHVGFGPVAGLCAGALVALHGTFFFEEGKVMKTPLGVALATGSLLLLVEARRRLGERRDATLLYFAAGVCGGLAALVRENFLLFVIVAVVWCAWRSRAARPPIALAAGAALAILPATAHNFRYDAELVPVTSQAGQNFYTGVHRGNPYGGYLVPEFVRRSPRFEEIDFAREAARREGRELTPAQTSRYWMREGWREVAGDPPRFAVLFARKLSLLYNDFEIPDDEDVRFFRRYAPVLRLPLPGFGFVAVLGLLGLAISLARRRAPPELVLFVVTYSISVALFFVFSRYRLLLVGPLAVFAGHALVCAHEELRARRYRSLAVGLVATVPLVLLVVRPIDAGFSFANSHLSLGIAWEVKGNAEAALAEYRQGLALEPDHRKLLRRAARLAADRSAGAGGDPREAGDLLRRAVAANPGDDELRFRLGTLLGQRGELEAAVAEFERILSGGSAPPGLHANLAIAYDRLGRPAEAARHAGLALRRSPGDPVMAEILSRAGSP